MVKVYEIMHVFSLVPRLSTLFILQATKAVQRPGNEASMFYTQKRENMHDFIVVFLHFSAYFSPHNIVVERGSISLRISLAACNGPFSTMMSWGKK